MRAHERYAALFQFLGGSLHQDWDLDAPTVDAAVTRALAETPPAAYGPIADEIAELLRSHLDDASLRDAVADLCCYLPSADGLSDREWLVGVRVRLLTARAEPE